MQKSSTGSGDQEAAPISDAEKSDAAGKAGAAAGKSSSTAGQSSGSPGKSSGAGGPNAASNPRSSDSSAASREAEEAAQLKRQLEEQDAQINKLRGDQMAIVGQEESAAEREAMEAERSRQQAEAAAGDQTVSGATPMGQDETGGSSSDRNTADGGGQPGAMGELERSVYFDYDQFSIPDRYDSMLIRHAAYLKAHPDVRAEVQGNCDERGSREYNLALGARRAESVKRALELSGADGSHIYAVSYGAEKPVASGKDEDSYSKNRRVDIFY